MHAYLTFVVFLAAIVASFAIPVQSVDGITTFFRALKSVHHESHRIQKRQNAACLRAIQEANSPQFLQCSGLFGESTTLSLDQLQVFCDDDNCVPVLIQMFTDFQSCGDSANSTVSSRI